MFFHSNMTNMKLLGAMLSIISLGGVMIGCSSPELTGNSASDSINHEHMMDHAMMSLGPADTEFDLRFIDAMIPHHEGAVIMAQEVLAKSQRPELLELAREIIEAQDQEMAQMQEWRASWYPDAPDTPIAWHDGMNHSMPMSPEQLAAMRMDMDLGAADEGFDRRFLEAMIPHHEAAVIMAQEVLEKSTRPEMQQLANDIMTSQQQEIDQMNQWLQDW
jgi:uncharacterized protein (DUF305 family)